MHTPVMVREVMVGLEVRPGGCYVDGTVGAGGHARALLDRMGPGGRLLALDCDEAAIRAARRALADRLAQCRFVRGNFADIGRLAAEEGVREVDGVVLDLGVSSPQIDQAERGFSFLRDGPLDMRMDRRQTLTAAALVNEMDEADLAALIRRLGEEPAARRIARALVRERQAGAIETTGRLAAVVARAVGGRGARLHPATRTFQALRMAVNRELESLAAGLEGALALLRTGGRLAALSYHSLEDGCVKRTGREHAGRWVSLEAGGARWEGLQPRVRWITRKPLTPAAEERNANPRSRSAKLRIMERISDAYG